MNFERKFFRAAAEFLRCRLELIPHARDAEGLMLGMWDQAGEMRLICREARRPPVGGVVLCGSRRQCKSLHR